VNPDTGHLLKMDSELAKKLFGKPETTEKAMKKRMHALGYQPVPKELENAAEKKLAGKDEAYVSLTSGGKLSKWAARQRKLKRKANARKAKNRAKMAKQSRKRNRRS